MLAFRTSFCSASARRRARDARTSRMRSCISELRAMRDARMACMPHSLDSSREDRELGKASILSVLGETDDGSSCRAARPMRSDTSVVFGDASCWVRLRERGGTGGECGRPVSSGTNESFDVLDTSLRIVRLRSTCRSSDSRSTWRLKCEKAGSACLDSCVWRRSDDDSRSSSSSPRMRST